MLDWLKGNKFIPLGLADGSKAGTCWRKHMAMLCCAVQSAALRRHAGDPSSFVPFHLVSVVESLHSCTPAAYAAPLCQEDIVTSLARVPHSTQVQWNRSTGLTGCRVSPQTWLTASLLKLSARSWPAASGHLRQEEVGLEAAALHCGPLRCWDASAALTAHFKPAQLHVFPKYWVHICGPSPQLLCWRQGAPLHTIRQTCNAL